MEKAPTIERVQSSEYDGELEGEQALTQAMDSIEERLGKHLESATPGERIAVTTELLKEVEKGGDNADRFIVEVYAGLKKMAELEQSFHEANAKLSKVIH